VRLPPERIGPYLRALQGGLHALAPSDAWVPLGEALAHLEALDPALSEEVLAPAELEDGTGMPAWAWLERARAEQALACEGGPDSDPSEDEIARASGLDPALGRRLQARAALHRFLRGEALLPLTRLQASLRRLGSSADVLLVYDRIAPDGRWLRLSIDLSLPPASLAGTFRRRDATRLDADPGVQHLLTRHGTTPLLALQQSVGRALGGPVTRLSRGTLGPFWFPGPALPAQAPPCVHQALVLHAALEMVASDIPADVHRDPWLAAPAELAPPGQHVFRERRFAASPGVVEALRAWSEERGAPAIVVPLCPRPVAAGPAPRTL